MKVASFEIDYWHVPLRVRILTPGNPAVREIEVSSPVTLARAYNEASSKVGVSPEVHFLAEGELHFTPDSERHLLIVYTALTALR